MLVVSICKAPSFENKFDATRNTTPRKVCRNEPPQ